MKIGIDIGTSFTKIAVPGSSINSPDLFQYIDRPGGKYISTAVDWMRPYPDFCLGSDAVEKDDEGFGFKHFGVDLKLSSHQSHSQNWWAAKDIVHKFFHEVLINDPRRSLQHSKQGAGIEELVFGVPHYWYADPENQLPDRLLQVFHDIGVNNACVRSEPISAAAYYKYEMMRSHPEQTITPINLLICDAGGGTFDVSLCQISQDGIQILEYATSLHRSPEGFGTYFARRCVADGSCSHPHPRMNIDQHQMQKMVAKFESQIITDSVAKDIIKNISRIGDETTPVYQQKEYGFNVSYAMVQTAFEPIKEVLHNTLDQILIQCKKNQKHVDRFIVIGGFGTYPLVETEIYNYLSIIELTPDTLFTAEHQSCAVAYGAYCVANGLVSILKPYQHSVGLETHQYISGLWHSAILPIFNHGETRYDSGVIVEKKPGVPLVVQTDRDVTLPLVVQGKGGEDFRKVNLPATNPILPGRYHIKGWIDRFNRVHVMFENIEHKEKNSEFILSEKDLGLDEEPL